MPGAAKLALPCGRGPRRGTKSLVFFVASRGFRSAGVCSRRLGFVLVLGALSVPSLGHAEVGELILAIEPGYALVRASGRNVSGGGGSIDLAYGVHESLFVRATGAFSAHPVATSPSTPSGLIYAYHAGAGLTYTLDVLRFVPYIDFSIGLLGTMRHTAGRGTTTSNQFGVQIGLGLDYLVSRRVSVGVIVRYHAYLTALTEIPAYLFVGPRLAFHFGG